MEDKEFLENALKQAFAHPLIRKESDLLLFNTLAWSDHFILVDLNEKVFSPVYIPFSYIKKQENLIRFDFKRNEEILAQYQIFKHYLHENIVVPDNMPEAGEFKQRLDLQEISRQAAQKKKILAAIIPADFAWQAKDMKNKHDILMQNTLKFAENNLLNWDLAKLYEFVSVYERFLRLTRRISIVYWFNKKRFISYLCEAVQILKVYDTLPDDFLQTRTLRGLNHRWSASGVRLCNVYLHHLLKILQSLAKKPELLALAQNRMAGLDVYKSNLAAYKKQHEIKGAEKSVAVYRATQKCIECFAFLNYLEGVRFSFENLYLNECPEPRNPAMQTVSPKDELNKINKIVSERRKVGPASGKIAALFNSALAEYIKSGKILEKMLNEAK